jgi:tetratricopeptide (TPR) repeat protein
MSPDAKTMSRLIIFGLLLLSMAEGRSSFAQEPFVPQRDDQVLERLPKTLSLNRDRMASIREKLAADPNNSDLASAAALGYIKMGNDESDPRFYGYARSAVKSWWDEESPPPSIVKIRAKLNEKDHKYKEAIVDLVGLLNKDANDLQAWVEVINLYRVVGDYDAARQSLERLSKADDQKATMIASIPLMAATGLASSAYDSVAKFSAEAEASSPEMLPWAMAIQGDIAASLGKFESADEHYRKALSLNGGSIHLKRTYADFLLDHQRPEPVLQLLAEHENDNGCLLLMAIAANRLGKTEVTAELKSKLTIRFKEIRLRGSLPHGRFESRYELELNDNPERALEVALENWQLQKEVRDARAVLESASVLKNATAAQPIIDFLKKSKNEDVALNQLIRTLEQQ